MYIYIYLFQEENSESYFDPVNMQQCEMEKVTLVIREYEPNF
jgi:hypothetical protein